MPWSIPGDYVVKIGGNYFENCRTILTFDDAPLFSLGRRENDLRLGIDFDVYDQSGKRIATIRRGNIVQGNTADYDIYHGPTSHTLMHRTTGRQICNIEKDVSESRVELAVTVSMYLPDGNLFEATPDGMSFPRGNMMTGCMFDNCETAIAIGGRNVAGVKL